MKQTILFTFLALLGISQAAAQDYEYVPFVREGVKWVYCIVNYDDSWYGKADPHFPIGLTYQTLEFKGDTVINGLTYKAMHKYGGRSINPENDTIPVYMREENKVVYCIVPDRKFYWECPTFLWGDMDSYNLKLAGEEFILYNFNDPVTFLDTARCDEEFYTPFTHLYTDKVAIGNNLAQRYAFDGGYDDFYVVEGIGYDGWSSYPLRLWFAFYPTGSLRFHQEADFYLSHVIEDGKIVYKGKRYKESGAFLGDYNGDGQVTISDVTALINLLLSGTATADCDLNGDGQVTISDVTALINYLLSHKW